MASQPEARRRAIAEAEESGEEIWRPSRESWASRMVPDLFLDWRSPSPPDVYRPMIRDSAPGEPYP